MSAFALMLLLALTTPSSNPAPCSGKPIIRIDGQCIAAAPAQPANHHKPIIR